MSSWADKVALFDTQLAQLGVEATRIEEAKRGYRQYLPREEAGPVDAALHVLLGGATPPIGVLAYAAEPLLGDSELQAIAAEVSPLTALDETALELDIEDISVVDGEFEAVAPPPGPPTLPGAPSSAEADGFSGLVELDARRNLEVGDLTAGDPTVQSADGLDFGDFEDEATCIADTIIAE